jgi:hypothetical protein
MAVLFYGMEKAIMRKGDHDMWYSSPITKHSFPVDGEIKSRHMANVIMKQAGIDYHF